MIAQKYDDYNNLRIGYDMVSKTETIYETSENSITSINEKNVAEKPAYVDKIIKYRAAFSKIYTNPYSELNEIIAQKRAVLSK